MSRPRIVFVPDFGAKVGGGHVMRCLTLAAALEAKGAETAFRVEAAGARIMATFAPAARIVGADWPADVVVVDGYDYTIEDERAAAGGAKLVALDDLLREHDCDLIIDPGLGRTAADYPGRAKVLAGAAYAPVRGEFTALRESALKRRDGTGGRLMLSLGLTDVGGITARMVRMLAGLGGWDAMDVVLGSGAASLAAVRAMATEDARITLHVDSREMPALTAACDFAIGAGGGSQWERSVLGLPTMLLVLAENQAASAAQLAALGAALVLDVGAPDFDARFVEMFPWFAGDALLRRGISARSAELVDGFGAERVAEAVLDLLK